MQDIKGFATAANVVLPNDDLDLQLVWLKAMEDTTDGFEIARRDLAIRGPGEFFGERQSGTMPLKIANLGADMRLLTDAQSAAKALLKQDPTLSDYPALRERVAEMFAVEDAFH